MKLSMLDRSHRPYGKLDATMTPSESQPEVRAGLIVELTQLALSASDVPAAVAPILDTLVARTAAAGSAYFQSGGGFFRARSAAGAMPEGPTMDAILAHGLPADTPLMRALEKTPAPLFFDDTHSAPEAAGFSQLGVTSLAAAPVRDRQGRLLGAFLMHTFEAHVWLEREAELFGAVAGVLANLAARLVAEEQAEEARRVALAAREDAIRSLGLAVENRDSEVKGHTDRVTDLALRIGGALGLDEAQLNALRWGAYLHDVGKISIPDAILHKPGRLTGDEWQIMKTHAQTGYLFAERLTFLPQETLQTVLHHHERWAGGGYPHNKKGEDIPLLARIFSVCDVYDALTSKRPYKEPWSHEAAVAEIQKQAGEQFDPAVVEAFLNIF